MLNVPAVRAYHLQMQQMDHLKKRDTSAVLGKRKLICIEGNIGAGKSTLLSDLKLKLPNMGFIEENISQYTVYKNYNPLIEMYQNPMQNSPIAQLHFIRSINNILFKKSGNHDILITDRSIFSPRVFGDTLCQGGWISTFTRDYLSEETLAHAKQTLELLNAEYVGMFYMNTPVDICLERINKRSRQGERFITIEYLKNIENSYIIHRDWWSNHICSPIEICDETEQSKVCDQFTKFMNQLA